MKRSKFLAFLSTILLAPLGLRSKEDEFVTFTVNPEDVGKEYWWFEAKMIGSPIFTVDGPGIGYHSIDVPNDGIEHDIVIKSNGEKIEYFIDGILCKTV